MIDAVGRLDIKSAKLQARVGIATGLMVVGDLIGEGSAQDQSVVGETPNLAAWPPLRSARGHGDADQLRPRGSQYVVHFGFRRIMRPRVGLRIPSRRVAIRSATVPVVWTASGEE